MDRPKETKRKKGGGDVVVSDARETKPCVGKQNSKYEKIKRSA